MLHVTKTKTVRKCELNISGNFMKLRVEVLFVGRCSNNIYTMWVKHYQKYIQEDKNNVFKGDANCHLSTSFWDDAQ